MLKRSEIFRRNGKIEIKSSHSFIANIAYVCARYTYRSRIEQKQKRPLASNRVCLTFVWK